MMWRNVYKIVLWNWLIFHDENTKEVMSVKESVYAIKTCIKFNFDFLALYKMYFQDHFVNRST